MRVNKVLDFLGEIFKLCFAISFMKKRVIGLLLVILSGLLALFNLSFTGAVVGFLYPSYFAFVSLGIFIIGVALIFVSGDLEEIAKTAGGKSVLANSRMRRTIRKHHEIIDAIGKIGTNKGRQEHLKGYRLDSIRAGKGEKLLFTDEANVVLAGYVPDHDYETWLKNNGGPYRK